MININKKENISDDTVEMPKVQIQDEHLHQLKICMEAIQSYILKMQKILQGSLLARNEVSEAVKEAQHTLNHVMKDEENDEDEE